MKKWGEKSAKKRNQIGSKGLIWMRASLEADQSSERLQSSGLMTRAMREREWEWEVVSTSRSSWEWRDQVAMEWSAEAEKKQSLATRRSRTLSEWWRRDLPSEP